MSARRNMNEEKLQQQLRSRLRSVREYLNLSQQFVAEQTGISRTAITDIERGARKVDSLELLRLSQVYRYPVTYFLGDGEDEKPRQATLHALARTAGDLTEKDREEVLRFANFLRHYGRSRKKRTE